MIGDDLYFSSNKNNDVVLLLAAICLSVPWRIVGLYFCQRSSFFSTICKIVELFFYIFVLLLKFHVLFLLMSAFIAFCINSLVPEKPNSENNRTVYFYIHCISIINQLIDATLIDYLINEPYNFSRIMCFSHIRKSYFCW